MSEEFNVDFEETEEDYYYDEFDEFDEFDEHDEFILKYHGSIKSVLEYERTYDTLTPDELIDLIKEAKDKQWKALDLSHCGLNEIPSDIGMLTELRVLELSNDRLNSKEATQNRLITLPKEIGKLENLEELGLFSTGIQHLPAEISNLKNLRFINLNGSDFKEFPVEICSLEGLEKLAIDPSSYSIPNNIGDMKNLEQLYLPDAAITTLPESVGNLKKLRILYLGRSNISELPLTLKKLENLKRIDLEETPISDGIPPEILNQTPAQIIDYILRYQEDKHKVIINESKMIIVGQGGVGKTSLLNRIINDEYIESSSTEGIDVTQWCFESEGREYKLNTWDFGGQEIYHSTHQFFLTKRSLYVFVWDARQEEEYGRIDYWLNTIQSFANDSPIIIVINKCDEERKNIRIPDLNNLKKRFPQIIESFNVSCLDNTNIGALKEEIIRQAKKLPLMKTVWFSSWVKLREELEEISKKNNIINYDEYIQICSKYNIDDNEAISLIKYLHDLGVVLHFHDDNLLKSIVILSPEWGTDAVYKILDAQANILKNRNGILCYNDLSEIWTDKTMYPENMYPYILKLMENFQLSFVIENNKTFLIPELLDNTEKHLDLDIQSKETLNFRYIYNFLPAGIVTKFIVKAHKLLIDENGIKSCWRKGAYLRYKDAYCVVNLRDGITERYVDIKVSGNNNRNCRELLTYVRKNFEEIHSNIPKIDFTENVLCNCSPECDYLHDYVYLIKLEDNNIIEERCKTSLRMIEISLLLDGIQLRKERKREVTEININPIFNNSPVINTSANATNNNTITVEIRNSINELQGSINELTDELVDVSTEITSDFENISSSVVKLDKAQTKEEIIKSGSLNKIRRFIEGLSNPETSTGKFVSGLKYGHSILQDIAEKYNSIAEWCGSPIIPKVFLKNK